MGLRSTKRGDYRATVALGSRMDWEPCAGNLDWSAVDDLPEFHVRLRYTEYQETRKESRHSVYDGRRDFRRARDGRTFSRTVCKVRIGDGDHLVRIKHDGADPYDRIVPKDQVLNIVRLFASVQYVRRGLDIMEDGDASIEPARMVVRPA
jgi:hypothetical protein